VDECKPLIDGSEPWPDVRTMDLSKHSRTTLEVPPGAPGPMASEELVALARQELHTIAEEVGPGTFPPPRHRHALRTIGSLNSVSAFPGTFISSKSRVYSLKDGDPVGHSASRSLAFSKRTVLIGRTDFDTIP
jgi:hypothetical protein